MTISHRAKRVHWWPLGVEPGSFGTPSTVGKVHGFSRQLKSVRTAWTGSRQNMSQSTGGLGSRYHEHACSEYYPFDLHSASVRVIAFSLLSRMCKVNTHNTPEGGVGGVLHVLGR